MAGGTYTDAYLRGESICVLGLCAVDSSGAITGIASEWSFDFVSKTQPSIAAPASSGSDQFIQGQAANGNTAEWPKNTAVYDGATGSKKSNSGSSGGDKLSATLLGWSKAFEQALIAHGDKPILMGIPKGDSPTSANNGWYYTLGQRTSAIDPSQEPEKVQELTVEVTGKSFTATSAGDTALAWAPAAVTPAFEEDPVTPTPLASGDLTLLKAGNVVLK